MSCRLMSLPAELRLIIYEFAFSPDRPYEEDPKELSDNESAESEVSLAANEHEDENEGPEDLNLDSDSVDEDVVPADEELSDEEEDDPESSDSDLSEDVNDDFEVSDVEEDLGSEESLSPAYHEIQICDQMGPQSDLLATCKQIKEEAQAAYDNATELFLSRKHRYYVTLDAEALDECNARLPRLVYEYGGPKNLPRARSLRIYFEMGYGESTFHLHFEVRDSELEVTYQAGPGGCRKRYLTVAKKLAITYRDVMDEDDCVSVEECLNHLHESAAMDNWENVLWPEAREALDEEQAMLDEEEAMDHMDCW